MPSRRRFPAALFASILLLTGVIPSAAQELSRRLILKDGSYQLVTKYEIKGDRVHYYSSERDEWEDMPSSLVDWPATEKYEKERAAGASVPEAVQLDKEIAEEQAKEEAPQPQVAPGLRLPSDSGVFLLDTFRGEPQVVEIQQNSGDVAQSGKANILRAAIPGAGVKQNIEIAGAHAAVQSHVDVPTLYINIDESPGLQQDKLIINTDSPRASQSSGQTQVPQQPQQPQQPEKPIVPFNRFHIVRIEVKGDRRIVGDVKRQVSGKITQEQHFINSTITEVAGGWLKLTPTESLAPGEYAIVETQDKDSVSLSFWDFGVNPKAPPNANAVKPDAKGATAMPPAESDKKP
jgi:hypothetical protein